MKQLVYIASAAHSGSTVLNAILGTAPNVVSLGEVSSTFNRLADGAAPRDCSCGSAVANCPVWGPVAARHPALGKMAISERYDVLVEALDSVYGPDCKLADASKRWDTLEAYPPLPES